MQLRMDQQKFEKLYQDCHLKQFASLKFQDTEKNDRRHTHQIEKTVRSATVWNRNPITNCRKTFPGCANKYRTSTVMQNIWSTPGRLDISFHKEVCLAQIPGEIILRKTFTNFLPVRSSKYKYSLQSFRTRIAEPWSKTILKIYHSTLL
jgi:hypothetical protein